MLFGCNGDGFRQHWTKRTDRSNSARRKKWKWRERNETLAGHDHEAEADNCAVASPEARVKGHAHPDRRQTIFRRVGSSPPLPPNSPPPSPRGTSPVKVVLTRQLFFLSLLLLDILRNPISTRVTPYRTLRRLYNIIIPRRIARGALSDAGPSRSGVPITC